MIIRINEKINHYILRFGWSENLSKLIGKEIEIDIENLKIFPLEENDLCIYTIEIENEYRTYNIPLDCLGYRNLEIKKKYGELKKLEKQI